MEIQVVTNNRVFKWDGIKDITFYPKEHKIHIQTVDNAYFILTRLNNSGVMFVTLEDHKEK